MGSFVNTLLQRAAECVSEEILKIGQYCKKYLKTFYDRNLVAYVFGPPCRQRRPIDARCCMLRISLCEHGQNKQ